MYTHTIAIARCLLNEGRLADVDRMISNLLPPDNSDTSSTRDEVLLLRCLLAQARLFRGTPPEEVLSLFSTETRATEPAEHLESAIARLSIGLALVLPDPKTQDLPRALHLFHLTQEALRSLGRSDFLHWTYIGQAVALYCLHEYKEAASKLEKAATFLSAIKDQVAQHWFDCISVAFASKAPISFKCLSQIEANSTARKNVGKNKEELPADNIYVSAPMHALLRNCRLAAEGTAPILLLGERGSGKETTARLIHECQPRNSGGFEMIDCAAITGYWDVTKYFAGASTSDKTPKTLFLNHVDNLSDQQQQSLLAYFKEVDIPGILNKMPIRIISASTVQFSKMVHQGRFDVDLYHRLKICTLEIPPLRMHKQDIPMLALHYAKTLRPAGVSRVAITEKALSAFLHYDWPGNIRQLKNEIERILVHISFEPLPTIDFQNLSKVIQQKRKPLSNLIKLDVSPEYPLDEILTDTERTVIERVLAKYQGKVSSAANALGLTRQGLYKKLKRLGIRLSK